MCNLIFFSILNYINDPMYKQYRQAWLICVSFLSIFIFPCYWPPTLVDIFYRYWTSTQIVIRNGNFWSLCHTCIVVFFLFFFNIKSVIIYIIIRTKKMISEMFCVRAFFFSGTCCLSCDRHAHAYLRIN